MGSLSPIAIALLVVCAVSFVGAFLAYFRDRRAYRGHEEYAEDVRSLAKRLNGDIHRDGDDLVVLGNVGRLPAKLRFSFADDKPALNIRVQAPCSFSMSIVPKGARSTEGRVMIRTQDAGFDARFYTRTDQPTEAKMFITSSKVMDVMRKLCCSANSFVTFTPGAVELSELAMPGPYPLSHINEHLDQIQALSTQLARMPKAHKFEPKPRRRDRRLLMRTAIAAGVIAAVASVVAATKAPATLALSEIAGKVDTPPVGMRLVDVPNVPDAPRWQLASTSDVHGDLRAWMNEYGVESFGKVELSFGSEKKNRDVAYLLLGKEGQRRVVVMNDGHNSYDMRYSTPAAIARVPKSAFANMPWVASQPGDPDGDGLLIIKDPEERSSGIVLFFSSSRLTLAAVKDYAQVRLMD